MSRHASSYSSGVAVGSFERVDQSVSTIMSNISKVSHFFKFSHQSTSCSAKAQLSLVISIILCFVGSD